MPGVAEVVTRSLATPFATGAYNGDETILTSGPMGQTLNLSLAKSGSLAVTSCQSTPAYTVNFNEALNLTVTKTAALITVHFALDVHETVSVTKPDGTTIPYTTSLDITGDLMVNPATGCCTPCHISYCGQTCDAHGGDQSHGAISITDADTAFSFDTLGADGSAALIIAANHVTNAATFAAAPDPHSATIGAFAAALGGPALELAFPPHYGDPAQGVDGDDAAVLKAMAQAALGMIADPGSQAVATAGALHATAEGAELAVDDALAAFGVVQHPPPGAILLG